VGGFLNHRLGLSELGQRLSRKQIPRHRHSVWYYAGGLLLCLLLVQLVSGILLMLYYDPGPEAYDSVKRIQDWIDFGRFVRSLHIWAAWSVVLVAIVHLASTFFLAAYREPRELTWWSGLVLFTVVLAFAFSGILLPMDTVGYFATQVALDVASSVPFAGQALADLFRGGPMVGAQTVQRFYVLHVAILPLLTVLLASLHLYLVQRHGNALPRSEQVRPKAERSSMAYWPTFVRRGSFLWLCAIAMLVALTLLSPFELGVKADPLAPTPDEIRPDWEFIAIFQALRLVGRILPGAWGEIAVVTTILAVCVGLLVVPFVNRESVPRVRSRLVIIVGLGVLSLYVLLTVWGIVATTQ
jgi:cytochrome b6